MVVWLREHQTVLLVNNRVNCSEKQQQEESKKYLLTQQMNPAA